MWLFRLKRTVLRLLKKIILLYAAVKLNRHDEHREYIEYPTVIYTVTCQVYSKITRFLCITFTFEPYTCKQWGKPAKRPEFVATTQIRHIIRVRYVSVYVPYLYHVYIFMYFSKYRIVCLVGLQTQTPRILSFTTRSSWIYIYQIQSRCTCQ